MAHDKIRNVPAFIRSYLKSDTGKSALTRSCTRERDTKGKIKVVWRSSQMAHAFQHALGDLK